MLRQGTCLMKELLSRVRNVLIRPGAEWRVIKDEPVTYQEIMLRYVCVLAAVPPVAAVISRAVFDAPIPGGSIITILKQLFVANLLWYCMSIMNVVITGAVITAVTSHADSRWSGLRGLKISAYSFTPLFAAGLLAVIPHMAWSVNVAILYGLYTLYLGIRILSALPAWRAAWYAGVSFTAAAIIVGVLNFFEYMLESFVAEKVIF